MLEPQFVLYVLLLSGGIVWLALGAMNRWRGPGALAWILFGSIAFWSGALAFLSELGAQKVELASVIVQRKSMPLAVHGLFLGRTSKNVYIASANACGEDGCRRVLSIGDADVGCVVFGPDVRVPDSHSRAHRVADADGFADSSADAQLQWSVERVLDESRSGCDHRSDRRPGADGRDRRSGGVRGPRRRA